jgi:hypothetical protein
MGDGALCDVAGTVVWVHLLRVRPSHGRLRFWAFDFYFMVEGSVHHVCLFQRGYRTMTSINQPVE